MTEQEIKDIMETCQPTREQALELCRLSLYAVGQGRKADGPGEGYRWLTERETNEAPVGYEFKDDDGVWRYGSLVGENLSGNRPMYRILDVGDGFRCLTPSELNSLPKNAQSRRKDSLEWELVDCVGDEANAGYWYFRMPIVADLPGEGFRWLSKGETIPQGAESFDEMEQIWKTTCRVGEISHFGSSYRVPLSPSPTPPAAPHGDSLGEVAGGEAEFYDPLEEFDIPSIQPLVISKMWGIPQEGTLVFDSHVTLNGYMQKSLDCVELAGKDVKVYIVPVNHPPLTPSRESTPAGPGENAQGAVGQEGKGGE